MSLGSVVAIRRENNTTPERGRRRGGGEGIRRRECGIKAGQANGADRTKCHATNITPTTTA
jgi:hypothetical protein